MGKIETREYHVRVTFGAERIESRPTPDLQVAKSLQDAAQAAGLQAQIVRVKSIKEVVN